MRTAPSDLEIETIVAALTEGWGMHCPMLHYLPRGFGSHHWQAKEPDGTHWFVTVDDLRAGQLDDSEEQSFARLTSAFRTADALRHQARLDFVVNPVADAAGRVAVRLGDRYSLAVFPALDLEPRDSGEFRTASDREETLRLVGLVHLATDRIPHDGLRRDTLRIPNRSNLLGALRSLDRAWDAGPFGEPARSLVAENAGALLDALRRFDLVAGLVLADTSRWVVTHGEPHAGNAIRTQAGNVVLVDWDTVAIAPHERDLWMLVDARHPDWSAYRDLTGVASLSEIAMEAYRDWWALSEIAIYVTQCHARHERTEDMEIEWAELQGYLSELNPTPA